MEVDGTGLNDRATRSWFEAKVGVIFSGAEEVGKDRVEILDKRTYATRQKVSAFGERFVIEAHKDGVFNSEEGRFTGSIYVLDFWHLARNIKVSLGAELSPSASGPN